MGPVQSRQVFDVFDVLWGTQRVGHCGFATVRPARRTVRVTSAAGHCLLPNNAIERNVTCQCRRADRPVQRKVTRIDRQTPQRAEWSSAARLRWVSVKRLQVGSTVFTACYRSSPGYR